MPTSAGSVKFKKSTRLPIKTAKIKMFGIALTATKRWIPDMQRWFNSKKIRRTPLLTKKTQRKKARRTERREIYRARIRASATPAWST